MDSKLPNQLAQQPLIVAVYARVSTSRQENEQTIESQIEEIKARIEADGNILPPENIFIDDGWTGEMLQRPQLDAMRDAAQAGNFQVLYVYDRGRLSRVFAYQEIILEEIIDKGIKFITLHDVSAETPEERVLQAMQGVFHEYERVKIAERMRRGKLYKARNGILINGHSLYGLDYIKKTETTPAHCKINEEQARVVRMVFDWVGNEGISLRDIIKRLYDMGVPPRKGKTQFWTKGPLVRLLQCDTYVDGKVYFNKSEAIVAKNPIKNGKYKKIKRSSRRMRPREEWIPFDVPTILEDRDLFNRVQKILENNQKYATRNRKYDYLLSGLVYCDCGNRRAGDGSNKYGHHYYRCAERIYRFPLEKKCNSQGVNAIVLDGLFWKKLVEFLNDPEELEKQAEEDLRSHEDNTVQKQGKERLTGFINKITEEEERYGKAYGVGTLDFEQFRELMKDAKRRKSAYLTQLNGLSSQINQDQVNTIELDEMCQEATKVLKGLDYSNKVKVVRDIIDRVIVKERSGVEVCGHIPLFTQKLGYEPASRDSWTSKCREKYIIQCPFKKEGGSLCQLSFCHC